MIYLAPTLEAFVLEVVVRVERALDAQVEPMVAAATSAGRYSLS